MDLTDRLAAERRGRLAAERLLELKSRELFAANRKLSEHALSLSGQIIEQRGEAEKLKTQTEEVRAELQRAEEHVEVIERRLWDSVETITDGFAVFDAQDRLIAANTAWLSMFGYSKAIGPGTLYLEVMRVAVEEGHIDLQGEEPGVWIGRMLERWDRRDPTEDATVHLTNGTWFRLLARRSRDGDMVCTAQNVTAMKEREAELDEARHRAEAANRAKSAFLANMSHELRTPMNGVVGMADMLMETDLEEEQALFVSTIKSSGESLLEIINNVLDFSKMEAERLSLRPAPFDLERLVHEVLTLLMPAARDRGVALHVDYDLFLPTQLVGDQMRIRQILINLVGNAVKFTSEGHVLIRVVGFEADADTSQWQVHLTVEDTGIGIPADMKDHIFGSFAQVESETNRSFEGTGLGLAITSELVQLMGGEIWVESEEGEGACFGFRVTLPAEPEPRDTMPRMDPGDRCVLLVSAPGLNADIMARQLAQLGLEVIRARSGSEGLAHVQDGLRPWLVAVEEELPDTTGRELAGALRAMGSESACLLICANMQEAARLEAASGAARDVPGHRRASDPPPSSDPMIGIDAVVAYPVARTNLFEALGRLISAGPSNSRNAPESLRSGRSAEPAHATPAPDVSLATPTASRPVSRPSPAHAGVALTEPSATEPPAAEPAVARLELPAPSHAAPILAGPRDIGPRYIDPSRIGPDASVPQPSGPEMVLLENFWPEQDGSDRTAPASAASNLAAIDLAASDPTTSDKATSGLAIPDPSTIARPLVGLGPMGESVPHELGEPSRPRLTTTRPQVETSPPLPDAPTSASSRERPSGVGTPTEMRPSPPVSLHMGAHSLRKMRVLAAEDNKTNRFVLAKMLQKLRVELHFAEDGEEAVDLFRSLRPDLVFMDISMPRMDGKDAARAIRAIEAEGLPPRRQGAPIAKYVPIVAMTAHALEGDREEILASGIDHYMTKPLKRASLVAHIVESCPATCLSPSQGEPAAVAG